MYAGRLWLDDRTRDGLLASVRWSDLGSVKCCVSDYIVRSTCRTRDIPLRTDNFSLEYGMLWLIRDDWQSYFFSISLQPCYTAILQQKYIHSNQLMDTHLNGISFFGLFYANMRWKPGYCEWLSGTILLLLFLLLLLLVLFLLSDKCLCCFAEDSKLQVPCLCFHLRLTLAGLTTSQTLVEPIMTVKHSKKHSNRCNPTCLANLVCFCIVFFFCW